MKSVFIKTALLTAATLSFSTLSFASDHIEEALAQYHVAAPSTPVLTVSGLTPEYQDFVKHLLTRKEAEKGAFLEEVATLRAQVKEMSSHGSVGGPSEKPSNELDRAGKEAGRIARDVKNFFKEKKDDEKDPAPSFVSTLPVPLQHTLQAPEDFSSALYGFLNPDVLEAARQGNQDPNTFLTFHFLTYAQQEGRAYK
ncbi:MAG: hypothetical protein H2057_06045 [Alphaproteobacteria bacterium]|nr:hypothetical protein [Alphaproteobacteria bacterium]